MYPGPNPASPVDNAPRHKRDTVTCTIFRPDGTVIQAEGPGEELIPLMVELDLPSIVPEPKPTVLVVDVKWPGIPYKPDVA